MLATAGAGRACLRLRCRAGDAIDHGGGRHLDLALDRLLSRRVGPPYELVRRRALSAAAMGRVMQCSATSCSGSWRSLIVVGLLWLLSPILLPFVLGMAIAYVLDPLAKRLTARGMSRLVAALVILAGFVVAIRAVGAADRAGSDTAVRRFHRTRAGLCAASAVAGQRSRAIPGSNRSSATIWSAPINRSATSDESGGRLSDRISGVDLEQGPGADFDLFTGDHHAGRRVLSDLRLGQHGGCRRSADPAAAARHRARPRP